MKLNILNLRKSINKAFLKVKPNRSQIENFKKNILHLYDQIDESESEEFHKNIIRTFLRETFYSPDYYINTKGKTDLVIHNGKDTSSTVGVLIETKSPVNKTGMPTQSNLNAKAMHELMLYYLRERITGNNKDIKHLVITNIYEWFVFDVSEFYRVFAQNKQLVKQYTEFAQRRTELATTDYFYNQIAKPFLDELDTEIIFTHIDIRGYERFFRNKNKLDDNKLVALFKLFSPEHLLKLPFANDSNTLDKRFYTELLHIIGLQETKEGSKKLIGRKKETERNTGSLIENAITILKYEDCLSQIKTGDYGANKEEQLYNVALELVITWMNRILFLKLLEGQLVKYHSGDKQFQFLNSDRIADYDELNKLFFQVLAVKERDRSERNKKKFANIPYLNSSLFEPNELEHKTIRISNLEDEHALPVINATVLKDKAGKRISGKLNTLEYLFAFLDAYDFSSEGSEEIQEENKTLINASVLGLIFEKINGYKDGSFFTPGFITMYMSRETIRRAIVEKFNSLNRDYKDSEITGMKEKESLNRDSYDEGITGMKEESLNRDLKDSGMSTKSLNLDSRDSGITTIRKEEKKYKNIDDVYNAVGTDFTKAQANEIVNSLKICDPAVGSGHFLVSALNEIITIKSELKILLDKEGRTLRDYHVEVVNDELVVTNDEGQLFEYKPGSRESQRVQETLFHEKQTIIENCLFGVDINPNSVKICRLRLWIELLKNAYYKQTPIDGVALSHTVNKHRELETLPNIDINIKTGNSLISRYALDADMKKALKKSKWNIDDYRLAVMTYRNAQTKAVKREMENLIDKIKNDFESEIAANDKRVLRLNKQKGELFTLTNQQQLFELSRKEKTGWNKKVKKLTQNIQKLETELEEIRTNKIYENAFEWRFEFPEVLNDDGEFTGFDVVIGNPPYIRQEEFSPLKPYLQEHFETYAGTADLYVYFIELGIRNLKPGSEFTFIVPNKWMRAGYGKSLRNFVKQLKIDTILDFGDLPVFEEATTYPCILSVTKTKSSELFNALTIETLTFPEGLEKLVAQNKFEVLVNELLESGWSLTDAKVQKLLAKLRKTGIPLGEYVNGKIYYGIKTGLNEAFVIDEATKEKLISEDPGSAEIIKPFLAGRDIKRYQQPKSDKYLILFKNGETRNWFGELNEEDAWKNLQEKYPAITEHLILFKAKAKKRYDKGQYWWELRACDYYYEMDKEKIAWPETSFDNQFSFVNVGDYLNKTTFFIPVPDKNLLGILNSKLSKFYFDSIVSKMRGGYFSMSKVYVETYPVLGSEILEEKVTQILALKKQDPTADTSALEAEIDRMVYELYGLTEEEIAVVEGEK